MAIKKKATTAKKKGKPKAKKGLTQAELEQKLGDYVKVHGDELTANPNVTSVGVGWRHVDGKETNELSITFTVDSKISPQGLTEAGTLPIPRVITVDGIKVPTDIIQRTFKPSYIKRELKPKDERRGYAQTMKPGMSCGGKHTEGGTIGAFFKDRDTGRTVLLSNWHVLVGARGKLGDMVVQPGLHDDDRAEQNKIGEVHRSHLGAAGDCAISTVTGRSISNEPVGMKGVVIKEIGKPVLGDIVCKSGRTTKVTYGRVTRTSVQTKMSYEGGVSATVGGFEIGRYDEKPAEDNEMSRGGDSGSAWLAVDPKTKKPTGIMLGLHFGGSDDGTISEVAVACYAESVMNKLELEPLETLKPQDLGDDADALRTGFDKDFLPFKMGVSFSAARNKDLAALDGEKEIRYCHFSVWLSKSRKYPFCVAWNINGKRYQSLNRTSFRADRRGDLEKYQLTNDLYEYNPLDKGHIARRADLCWGSDEEAWQGNYDSFYYTNIAPQHEAFNQSEKKTVDWRGGAWGRLEVALFDSEEPHDLKVSLLGGPVFDKNDPTFEQNGEEARIPKAFWKIAAFVDKADGNKKKVFCFQLSQAKAIKGLVPQGIDLSEWVWARIAIRSLEEKLGVTFEPDMHDWDVPFVAPQGIGDDDGHALKVVLNTDELFD